MKRRRHDSDSEEETTQPALQAIIPQAANHNSDVVAPFPDESTLGSFSSGTLFSKGRRTQLASELATRVESGEFASGNLPPRLIVQREPASTPRDLIDQLEEEHSTPTRSSHAQAPSTRELLPIEQTFDALQTTRPAEARVPSSLTSIKNFVAKGMRPVMNCRIQDDELGRMGVWLPQSTLLSLNQGVSTADKVTSPSGSGATAGGSGPSSGLASTMLTVRPLQSERLRPLMPTTVASTGPIPLDVLRSLKGPTTHEEATITSGPSDNAEPVGQKGRRLETGAVIGDSGFSDPVSHIDVGGAGLQHPFFNQYCNTVLGNVTLMVDLVPQPTSSALTPVLTALSHSLSFKDIKSLYCSGTASTTARPSSRLANNAGKAESSSLLAHSASTKPHGYRLSTSNGEGASWSGWRWDGIVRGNPRMLANYRIEEQY